MKTEWRQDKRESLITLIEIIFGQRLVSYTIVRLFHCVDWRNNCMVLRGPEMRDYGRIESSESHCLKRALVKEAALIRQRLTDEERTKTSKMNNVKLLGNRMRTSVGRYLLSMNPLLTYLSLKSFPWANALSIPAWITLITELDSAWISHS